eukprot:1004883-Pelagomonas_calceolata.AAC.2
MGHFAALHSLQHTVQDPTKTNEVAAAAAGMPDSCGHASQKQPVWLRSFCEGVQMFVNVQMRSAQAMLHLIATITTSTLITLLQEGEAFHFIAYVPKGDALYELDGLKPGPIRLATLQPGVRAGSSRAFCAQ